MFNVVRLIENGLAIYLIRDRHPCVARLFYLHFITIVKTNKMTLRTMNDLCKIV